MSSFLKTATFLYSIICRSKTIANVGCWNNCALAISMSGSGTFLENVEHNFKKTEFLLNDINQKLTDIAHMRNQSAGAGGDVGAVPVDEECQRLMEEIEKWKELLTLRQIRNGKKFMRYSIAKPTEAPAGIMKAADNQGAAKTEGAKVDGKGNDAKSTEPTKADSNANVQKPESGKGKEPKVKTPKEQPPKASSNPAQQGGDDAVDVSRLDFRIGKIVQVEKHPDADSLYLEKVDVGEANPRTVVSGLVKHVPIEEMQDRMVVLLCNLKPAKMRGVTSEAMVMCASTPEKVEILIPPTGVVPGDLVDFEGFVRNPDAVLNPKKKIFETVAPDLKTDDKKVATYKGIPFTVKGKGVVTAATLANVNIK